SGICTACGEGRRPVTVGERIPTQATNNDRPGDWTMAATWAAGRNGRSRADVTITGYACACTPYTNHFGRWDPAPTRPAVVLDPFGGTGPVALVATAFGRHGITLDMSADYCRLAAWRTSDPKQLATAARKPFVPPREQVDGQMDLLDGLLS